MTSRRTNKHHTHTHSEPFIRKKPTKPHYHVTQIFCAVYANDRNKVLNEVTTKTHHPLNSPKSYIENTT